MKAAVLILFAAFAGCGGPAAAPASPAPPPVAELALPVTAPMQARERLLHDLGQQNTLAEGRADALEEVIRGNR